MTTDNNIFLSYLIILVCFLWFYQLWLEGLWDVSCQHCFCLTIPNTAGKPIKHSWSHSTSLHKFHCIDVNTDIAVNLGHHHHTNLETPFSQNKETVGGLESRTLFVVVQVSFTLVQRGMCPLAVKVPGYQWCRCRREATVEVNQTLAFQGNGNGRYTVLFSLVIAWLFCGAK